MRQALNAAYAALAGATENVDELDRELKAEPRSIAEQQRRPIGGVSAALMAWGKMGTPGGAT